MLVYTKDTNSITIKINESKKTNSLKRKTTTTSINYKKNMFY